MYVVKVFLESNFYHHVENLKVSSHVYGQPLPPLPPSGQLAVNWDET